MPAPTETAVSTILPTPVLTATPTPTPEPTPYPPLIWADDLSPINLGTYLTEWSPTSNELLLDNCLSRSSTKEILRADPPDFIPTAINSQDVACTLVNDVAIWTPDGAQIIFSGMGPDGNAPHLVSVWIMEKDSSNPRAIEPEGYRGKYLELLGWIAPDTLAYEKYTGGGSNVCTLLNINSGQIVGSAFVPGGFFDLTPGYLAGTFFVMPREFVIAMYLKPDPERNPSYMYQEGRDYVNKLPMDIFGDSSFYYAFFRGWRSSNPEMLVRYINQEGEGDAYRQITRLALWDLESDSVSILADGGVDGQFSPDGSLFAYLTLGSPWLDENNRPLTDKYEPISLDGQYHLNLLDMTTGVVSYSVPIFEGQIVYEDGHEGNPSWSGPSFSPDGQYLVYFSPADEGKAVLNVLDLASLQVVYSIPADAFFAIWSPDSSRFIYRDRQMNLVLLEMDTFSVTPLTLSGAQRIHFIDWSFDGQYISMLLGENLSTRDAIILKMPE